MGWIPRIGVGGALCVDVRARAVQERHRMLLQSAHISSPTGPLAAPCFFPSVTKASMGFVQRALVIRRCNRLFLPRAPLWTSLGAAPAGSFTSAPPLTSRARHSRSRPHQRAAPDVHQRRSEFLSALFQTTEQAAPHLQRGRLPEGSSTNAGPRNDRIGAHTWTWMQVVEDIAGDLALPFNTKAIKWNISGVPQNKNIFGGRVHLMMWVVACGLRYAYG
ncbi:uncharacterized protein [Lolium perenne]|uniref:uncharacterized protein isoform X2 n=1 Tax=Lolium perenne TaxID=4522 RepID=UPI0021F52863|nr:uncharacterized protein LOC127312929 [Lolium perenne]XP_051199425.1 uncharacterized protein LOC127312929 [Lolium perenne]